MWEFVHIFCRVFITHNKQHCEHSNFLYKQHELNKYMRVDSRQKKLCESECLHKKLHFWNIFSPSHSSVSRVIFHFSHLEYCPWSSSCHSHYHGISPNRWSQILLMLLHTNKQTNAREAHTARLLFSPSLSCYVSDFWDFLDLIWIDIFMHPHSEILMLSVKSLIAFGRSSLILDIKWFFIPSREEKWKRRRNVETKFLVS